MFYHTHIVSPYTHIFITLYILCAWRGGRDGDGTVFMGIASNSFKLMQEPGELIMDIPTSIIETSGTLMIRIPKEMVNELGLNKNMKVNAVNVNDHLIELHFRA